jgi:predicted TIM-barrel fold metal-dependent hydrolase
MAMADLELDFPVNDADNHMYEPEAAFTRYLPDEWKGIVKYVQVNGRTKIALRNVISDYIPNPTFSKVARPGAQEEYFAKGNPEGKSRREIMGDAMESPAAYFEPEPRLKLLDELGIDRTLMWPTLASLLEERLSDDPEATHVIIHALNQWMHETWTFNYQDRIYATPVITLPIVDKAIAELEWVAERGAKVVLIRPAPVPGYMGLRSFALPEFDPFWAKVAEFDIAVGMHSSDDGMTKYINTWEGRRDGEFLPFGNPSPFEELLRHEHRGIFDAMASAVGHGLFSRFPTLRVMPIENGTNWVRPLLSSFAKEYEHQPHIWGEDPIEVFKRNVWVHPFHEEDPMGLAELVGADRVLFGSDYPHPEGLADPVSYVNQLQGMAHDDIARIMGGNLADVLKLAS